MKRMRIGIVGALWAMLILGGCGGGGGSTANVTTPGKNSVAASISTSVPAAICPTGGIAINTGIDSNGNGVLDAAEITNTQYVCNGAAAANALMSVTDEPAGANCAAGGKKISVGLDTDNNGTLDPAEVTSSNYICNGTSGANGLNTLVSTTGEAPGANCVYGGLKVNSGLDSNSNGTLDAAEITNTSYACNVSAGSGGFTWVEVTASSVQAASNTGYMANNSAVPVTVTLPTAPAVGDVVKVSGIGAGGWKVVANAGQSIANDNLGSNATASLGAFVWHSIASSADGYKLVAGTTCEDASCNAAGQIYASNDAGASWALLPNSPAGYYLSVASSADGSKLVAASQYDAAFANGVKISTSADSGATWTLQANSPLANWGSVVSSADGSILVAVTNVTSANQIYVSTDSGVNWTLRNTLAGLTKVAMSADGSKMVATVSGGQIYTSADSGVTWVLQANSPVAKWSTVASSADGSKLVAASRFGATMGVGGNLYTSADGGVTWTQSGIIARFWTSVTSSADGSKLAATVDYGNQLFTSVDSGASWTLRWSGDTVAYWNGIVSSADGSTLAALSTRRIYTSGDSGVNWWYEPSTLAILGWAHSTIELQYIGGGSYLVLNSGGTIHY